jgi:hypothetical protein
LEIVIVLAPLKKHGPKRSYTEDRTLSVTLRRHDLVAEIFHLKEPVKIPLVLSKKEIKHILAMRAASTARMNTSPTTHVATATARRAESTPLAIQCQAGAAKTWLAAREAEPLPVRYFQLVFMLPKQIAPSRDVASQYPAGRWTSSIKTNARSTIC